MNTIEKTNKYVVRCAERCGMRFRVREELLGRKARCKRCGAITRLESRVARPRAATSQGKTMVGFVLGVVVGLAGAGLAYWSPWIAEVAAEEETQATSEKKPSRKYALEQIGPKVGDVIQVEVEESQTMRDAITIKGKQQPATEKKSATRSRYTLEVQAVGPGGQITRGVRRYEAFEVEGQEVAVKGVVVQVAQTDKGWSLTSADSAKPLPDVLAKHLSKASQKTSDPLSPLPWLPNKKVRVGESWTRELTGELADYFGAPGGEMDADRSKVEGVLEGTEERDGKTWLRVKLQAQILYTSFELASLEEPLVLKLEMTTWLPQDGGWRGDLHVDGSMQGVLRFKGMEDHTTGKILSTMSGTFQVRERTRFLKP